MIYPGWEKLQIIEVGLFNPCSVNEQTEQCNSCGQNGKGKKLTGPRTGNGHPHGSMIKVRWRGLTE